MEKGDVLRTEWIGLELFGDQIVELFASPSMAGSYYYAGGSCPLCSSSNTAVCLYKCPGQNYLSYQLYCQDCCLVWRSVKLEDHRPPRSTEEQAMWDRFYDKYSAFLDMH